MHEQFLVAHLRAQYDSIQDGGVGGHLLTFLFYDTPFAS